MDVGNKVRRCLKCGNEITDPLRLLNNNNFCCSVCANRYYNDFGKKSKEAKRNYEENPVEHAEYTGSETILRAFFCRNCGKEVLVVDEKDKRTVFCQQPCEKAYWRRVTKERCTGNRGLSGGMSLGSLIRREAEDLR